MSDDLVTTYLTQLIAAHRTREITIAFQGGEPTLMGVDFYRRLVAKAKEIAGPQRILEFTLQTNGTLLDDEWCEFLAAENVLVGLSLDGPSAMHDAYRVDKQGRPTYERVKAAWELLQRHNVATNVLCSVHAANADHGLEVYKHFRDDLGVRFIQLIPIVERATPELIVQADAGWGVRASERPLYVQDGSLVTERSVTLEHNGDVYSCDHYVEPEYLLGNISERHLAEMVASPQQQAFGTAKATTLPSQCVTCEVRFACHGECPRNRFATTADGEDGLNYLCAGYFDFFTHIDRPMKVMAELLRTGRPADEVVKILAEAD
jgi:uncharacterized protein